MEIGMRIAALREERDWKKTELARRLGISHSQVGRIESGETGTLSSDILIRLAEVFGVSADYLLGLTPIKTKKNLDIVKLGLSEKAALRLADGTLDMGMLCQLIEHERFPNVLFLMRAFLDNSFETGNQSRNDIIDFVTSTTEECVASLYPVKSREAKYDMKIFRAQKLCMHEAELEKIKSQFMNILRDIKGKDAHETPDRTMQISMIEKLRKESVARIKSGRRMEAEDVALITAKQFMEVRQSDDVTGVMFYLIMMRSLLSELADEKLGIGEGDWSALLQMDKLPKELVG